MILRLKPGVKNLEKFFTPKNIHFVNFFEEGSYMINDREDMVIKSFRQSKIEKMILSFSKNVISKNFRSNLDFTRRK